MASSAHVRFGPIGTGWRSDFFAWLAREASGAFEVADVRSPCPHQSAGAAA